MDMPDMHWDPGAEECTPALQRTEARAIDDTTIAIRQNPCVDYEANLLYLLIGTERALLSDAAFAALPDTTVVPHEGAGMRQFFGIKNWPADEARYDLGGREIVVEPAPGHHPDHVVFLDVRTRLLFTGDFYLPGRLLVEDIDAYRNSAMKLVEFVQVWGVEKALGAHVEMNARRELYSNGASYHPDEHAAALPLGVKEAVTLHGALEDFNGFYSRHPDYAIANPVHNLIALTTGVVLALVLAVWGTRRLLRRRRAGKA